MVDLKPSTFHRVLVGFFSITAVYAVFIAPLPLFVQIVAALLITLIAIRQLLTLSQKRTLLHQNEQQVWIEKFVSGSDIHGSLIPKGYRSAGLLVLVMQLDSGRYHHVVVWRDSVSRQQFSYLHHQLAFATTPARRRSLSAFLSLR